MNISIRNRHSVFLTSVLACLALLVGAPALAYTVIADASQSTGLSGIAPWTPNLVGGACTDVPTNYSCQWHWKFGDGTISDPTVDATGQQSAVHTYKFAGTYTVTLTVEVITPTTPRPTASTSLTVIVLQGETLNSYVTTCKQQLVFTDADMAAIAGSLNCNKGVLFAPSTNVVNDYFGYARVNDNVDLAFACRWANNPGTGIKTPPFSRAVSLELLINNHQNGNTCFFQASSANTDGSAKDISTAIVSPTVAAAAAPNTAEADFWNVPIQLDRNLICVDCHVAGPYISTPRIAPFLARFGLLNNGHDTFGLTPNAQNNPVGNCHIVGSTFAHFNNIVASENVVTANTCANGCHSIGYNSTQGSITAVLNGSIDTLLPAIASVVDNNGTSTPDISVSTSGVMPPVYDELSNYRWVNLDVPGNGVETENFADAMNHVANSIVPVLFHGYDSNNPSLPSNPSCTNPGYDVPSGLEAHAVGVPANFGFNTTQMAQLPDRLRTFNLKEGLVCLNSDQESGHQCSGYSIRYLCSINNINGAANWSSWYNNANSSDGDHEERYRHQNICGGVTPIAIEAEVVTPGNWPMDLMGPNDRLARFTQYGLTCNASDQVDGRCSNYVVRYDGCSAPPSTQSNKMLTNVYAIGKQLTAASSSLTKGQAHNNGWNTQQWNIEPVANTEYVRVHNPGTNIYLTVTSTAEQATVGTATLNNTASEMWTIETISGNSAFRFKNLFSGKYLTIADPRNLPSTPDYLPIYSQGLNTGWTSQLWIIQ